MHTETSPLLSAERFLLRAGRLLERLRFAHLFGPAEVGSAERVLSALRAYQNSDGGFGQALEPDFRGPVSQPLCVDAALRIVDEVGHEAAWSSPWLTRALDYLRDVSANDGGVPNVLPSVLPYERAPWWQPSPEQAGSLLSTASLAGLLFKHGVDHAWREPASTFVWSALAALPQRLADSQAVALTQALYETRASLLFLDHVPERARAEQVARQLADALVARGIFVAKPGQTQEAAAPLDFAGSPDTLAHGWFDQATLDQQLAKLLQAQHSEGYFPITWDAGIAQATTDYRGIQTVERLKTLAAYNKLPTRKP